MNTPSAAEPRRLGTFLGVFTPTILTIMGVIMFMRVGWVVGVAGVWGAIAIVVLANVITLLTALSVSALATNMRVGVGGAYYLISRSVGLEVGGAVGIPLYLSQVLSVTLYCYGLAESLKFLWADIPVSGVAALLVVLVIAIAGRSIEFTLKLQLPVMVLIIAAVISLLWGADWGPPNVEAIGPWSDDAGEVGFWGVFAVFFPAVTGILAGVSLSGDLEDPGTSIPKGVLISVAVGAVIYLVVPLALATSVPREVLLDDSLVWLQVAGLPALVMPGLWGAILSSAFGSALGAPRTLQALADDDLVPGALGAVDAETGEPTTGMWVTGALALIAVWLGDLNAVAEWVTIFFLTTYGALNTVAMIEILVGDPSYRPRIRIPWWAAAAGAFGCFVAMFAINPAACLVAVSVEVAIFWGLSSRSLETQFGDVRNGITMAVARLLIIRFTDAKKEARNWRPHLLLFTKRLERDLPAVRVAEQLGSHRGLLTVMTLVETDVHFSSTLDAMRSEKRAALQAEGMYAFCEVVALPEVTDATYTTIAQAHGVGGLDANTVMFMWDGHRPEHLTSLVRRTRQMSQLGKCTLIFRPAVDRVEPSPGRPQIVVWWKGLESNGDLMLLLAHLFLQTQAWGNARIALRTVVSDVAEARTWRESATRLADEIRIAVDAEAVVCGVETTIAEVIRESSKDAHLVLLGMSTAEPGAETQAAERLHSLVEGLPDTLLVRNSGPFRGRLL